MLQDQRSIMLANEGYFVVEVGYNCQKYGQKSIWTMPEYPVEYFEAVIQKALKHPRNITHYILTGSISKWYQGVRYTVYQGGYGRGDSMIWDFMGRRPLPVRDYAVSIQGGSEL